MVNHPNRHKPSAKLTNDQWADVFRGLATLAGELGRADKIDQANEVTETYNELARQTMLRAPLKMFEVQRG